MQGIGFHTSSRLQGRIRCGAVAGLVVFGCAAVPAVSTPEEGSERALRHAALEGERLFNIAAESVREWPALRLRNEPVLVSSPVGAVLLHAKASNGFLPVNGSECPCIRRNGVPSEIGAADWIFDRVVRRHPRGQSVGLVPRDAPKWSIDFRVGHLRMSCGVSLRPLRAFL